MIATTTTLFVLWIAEPGGKIITPNRHYTTPEACEAARKRVLETAELIRQWHPQSKIYAECKPKQ